MVTGPYAGRHVPVRPNRRRALAPVFALLAALVAVAQPGTLAAQESRPPVVVTVGESNDPRQVEELLDYFGATDDDEVVTVSVADTAEAMGDIYDLSGVDTAYSSTAFTCGQAGDGLEVSTRNIELVTPTLYAMALLTAGIDDGSLRIAAPASAPALGMTALTGVFLTWETADCDSAATDADRQGLALEELALTTAIGEALGAPDGVARATRIVLGTQRAVVAEGVTDADEIGRIVSDQEAADDAEIPAASRAELVDLMVRLGEADLDWGTFAEGWEAEQDASEGTVRLRGTGSDDREELGVGGMVAATPVGSPGASPDASPGADSEAVASPPAASPAAASPAASPAAASPVAASPVASPDGTPIAGLVLGTVVWAGGGRLTVDDGDGAATAFRLLDAPVYRDGEPVDSAAVVAGDRVRVTVDPATGRVARVDAEPAPAGSAAGTAESTAAGLRWWLPPIGGLALLAAAAFLVARRRRRARLIARAAARGTPDARKWLVDPPQPVPARRGPAESAVPAAAIAAATTAPIVAASPTGPSVAQPAAVGDRTPGIRPEAPERAKTERRPLGVMGATATGSAAFTRSIRRSVNTSRRQLPSHQRIARRVAPSNETRPATS